MAMTSLQLSDFINDLLGFLDSMIELGCSTAGRFEALIALYLFLINC